MKGYAPRSSTSAKHIIERQNLAPQANKRHPRSPEQCPRRSRRLFSRLVLGSARACHLERAVTGLDCGQSLFASDSEIVACCRGLGIPGGGRMRMSNVLFNSKRVCLSVRIDAHRASLSFPHPRRSGAGQVRHLVHASNVTADLDSETSQQASMLAGTLSAAPEFTASQPFGNIMPFGRCRALVLDSSYRPIDVVNWQRAICLDLFDKVDVLEYYETSVRSASAQFLIPAVLRVRMYVSKRELKSGRLSLSRRNILLRDNGQCQYCGTRSALTIDHVVPLSKGGKWVWENLVTACTKCNGKKGSKSLKQLGWKLKQKPKEPSPYQLGILLGIETELSKPPKEWHDYIFPFGAGDDSLGEELDGRDAIDAL